MSSSSSTYFSARMSFTPGPGAGPDEFESFLDAVLDELAKLGVDADCTASLARYEATIDWAVGGAARELSEDALGTLRTALHAAGCATPSWSAVRAPELVSAGVACA